MPTDFERGYCDDCDRHVRAEREAFNHLPHALITLFLLGLWLPVWLALALLHDPPYLCPRCGDDVEPDRRAGQPRRGDGAKFLAALAVTALVIAGVVLVARSLSDDPPAREEEPRPRRKQRPRRPPEAAAHPAASASAASLARLLAACLAIRERCSTDSSRFGFATRRRWCKGQDVTRQSLTSARCQAVQKAQCSVTAALTDPASARSTMWR